MVDKEEDNTQYEGDVIVDWVSHIVQLYYNWKMINQKYETEELLRIVIEWIVDMFISYILYPVLNHFSEVVIISNYIWYLF